MQMETGYWTSGEQRTNQWLQVSVTPLTARSEVAGAWVDNTFLLVGGQPNPPCDENGSCAMTSEPALQDGARFDPATGLWSGIAEAPAEVSGRNVAVVGDSVYILSATTNATHSPPTFLRYTSATDTWSLLSPPPPLGNPRLVAAGNSLLAIQDSDEYGAAIDSVFDPATGSWQPLPDDPLGPSFDREALWLGDTLLLTAKDLVPSPGAETPAVVRLATLDLHGGGWVERPTNELIGDAPVAVDDRVLWPNTGSADGGQVNNWGRSLPFGGVYDPDSGSWTPLPDAPAGDGLAGFSAVVGAHALVDGHLLEPSTGQWIAVPTMPSPVGNGATLIAGDNAILVWGGFSATGSSADGYLLHPEKQP